MNIKNIFKKDNMMPVIVLGLICLVVALVMGGVNMLTRDRIEENENAKVFASLKEVIEGHYEAYEELPAGVPDSVTSMVKVTDGKGGEELGTIVTLSVKGYAGNILMTVGIDKDNKVTKVVITSQQESHGKAGMKNYPDSFAGVSADELENVDTFSGATISSTAIKNGVIDAMNAVLGVVVEETLPKTDQEIKSLAATLTGVSADSLKDVTPDGCDTVKRVYKAADAYVVYTVTEGGYGGAMDTETLIHIGKDGKIKNIQKLAFITSPASDKYTPPSQDDIDALYGRLNGATSDTIGAVEVVTNATRTTNTLKGAINEAFGVVSALVKKDMPTAESEVKSIASSLMGVDISALKDVTPENLEFVKRIYKDEGGKGYAAYTVTNGGYQNSMDTETVIWIGLDGSIRGIHKINFITSPANDNPPYTPPSQDEINALYGRLNGATSDTIGAVDAVTNATRTTNTLKGAINEAFTAVAKLLKFEMPTAESEVKSLAAILMGISVSDLVDVTPDNQSFVRRLYKDKGGKGFAAYTVTAGGYQGSIDTQTVIWIDNDCTVKGIKKIAFITSPANDNPPYTPPTQAEIDALFDRLVGKNINSLGSVDAITNATRTTNTLKGAITEALEAVSAIAPVNYTARVIGIVAASLAVLGFAAYIAVPKIIRRRKEQA